MPLRSGVVVVLNHLRDAFIACPGPWYLWADIEAYIEARTGCTFPYGAGGVRDVFELWHDLREKKLLELRSRAGKTRVRPTDWFWDVTHGTNALAIANCRAALRVKELERTIAMMLSSTPASLTHTVV